MTFSFALVYQGWKLPPFFRGEIATPIPPAPLLRLHRYTSTIVPKWLLSVPKRTTSNWPLLFALALHFFFPSPQSCLNQSIELIVPWNCFSWVSPPPSFFSACCLSRVAQYVPEGGRNPLSRSGFFLLAKREHRTQTFLISECVHRFFFAGML